MSNAKSASGTQHVTKKPEATESGGIHGNPEYFEAGQDIEVCCQRQIAFSNEKQLESAEISAFVRIFSQSVQDSSAFDEQPRFWRMLPRAFPTTAVSRRRHGACRYHGVSKQEPSDRRTWCRTGWASLISKLVCARGPICRHGSASQMSGVSLTACHHVDENPFADWSFSSFCSNRSFQE